eukprot:g23847.t1
MSAGLGKGARFTAISLHQSLCPEEDSSSIPQSLRPAGWVNMADGSSAGVVERLKRCVSWSWTYLWALWFVLVLGLLYMLRAPLKLHENLSA